MVPSCAEALDHTSSAGGTVTLEMLSIDPGYWRVTEYSEDVLACYNADACLGGVTGTDGYCLEGYEGPCECFVADGGRYERYLLQHHFGRKIPRARVVCAVCARGLAHVLRASESEGLFPRLNCP